MIMHWIFSRRFLRPSHPILRHSPPAQPAPIAPSCTFCNGDTRKQRTVIQHIGSVAESDVGEALLWSWRWSIAAAIAEMVPYGWTSHSWNSLR